MTHGSWVITTIATKEAIFETFSEKIAGAINKEKYRAIPILEYLGSLNKSLKN
jgi:hypothetical protein